MKTNEAEAWTDPIVEEVRHARDEHTARFNYDLKAICADLRRRQDASDRSVLSLEPKRPDGATRGGVA